jgi:flavin reductase (DIM6/NTAB) family NADH-FMN oxidoreductase RutF
MPIDPEQFRLTMRAWTTGVTVIMTAHAGETYGMTVNSFNSVSLDPPVVAIALQHESKTHALVTKSQAFTVTFLSAAQRGLAEDFAGRKRGAARMAGVETTQMESGAPILAGGLAWLDCRVIHTYAAGNNTLFLAEVAEARVASVEHPLAYHNRGYHQLKE